MYPGQHLSTLMCGILLTTVAGQDCPYKECMCAGKSIYCDTRGLTTIPRNVSTSNISYDELDLDSNMITTIPSGILPPNLREITIMYNPITSIDDSAFDDSATTLESLLFSTVSFTKLPDAFLHLKNFKSLKIYDSTISDWNADVMKSLGQTLNTLYIENCGLTVWPEPIKYLSHLTELDLSSNFISSIPDNSLDNMVNSLGSLSLINNSLTSVPKAVSTLRSLTVLMLAQNRISDVSWLPQASKLEILSLSTNSIFDADQLSKALLPYGDTLNFFDIKSNNLLSIPNVSNLALLDSFDFSLNRISDPISGSLPPGLKNLILQTNDLPFIPKVLLTVKSVTDMALTSNLIREIRADDFPLWATWAELRHNLITELTDTSFPENASLQYLHLDNNPISRISNNAFIKLGNLSELTMSYTQLTRLPVSFSATYNLQYLDLTGNTNLVCTCAEKSLYPWIKALLMYDVLGQCGVTSIYEFFSKFSPFCPS